MAALTCASAQAAQQTVASSVKMADGWSSRRQAAHLGAYAEWAKTHNSLLIEDDNGANNHIPTIMYGARVRPGRYAERISHYRISHYNVLSTLLAMYGLPTFAKAATAPPIIIEVGAPPTPNASG
jgi:phosphatidylinositol-3-phosphatase